MLKTMSLETFADRVAAREPTPGGGSVAACLGAFGAALGSMAARFTEGKKAFAEHSDALAVEIEGLERLRARLLELIDADAEAYASVGAAMALPRGDEREKATRREAVQRALAAAMEPPLDVCRRSLEGLALLATLRTHVNPHLASDVAVGALALAAAHRAAWFNVLINARGLDDEERRARVLEEGAAMRAAVAEHERSITEAVETALA